MTLAAGGDTGAFNQLVVRWERPIFALAYRTLGREEDARDICQEAFLRAFRAIGGFKGQARFSSWLYRIALNLCRDWIRKERRVKARPGVRRSAAGTGALPRAGRGERRGVDRAA